MTFELFKSLMDAADLVLGGAFEPGDSALSYSFRNSDATTLSATSGGDTTISCFQDISDCTTLTAFSAERTRAGVLVAKNSGGNFSHLDQTRVGGHEPNRTGGGYPVLERTRAGVHVSGNNSSRLERTRGGDLELNRAGGGSSFLERTRAGVLISNKTGNNSSRSERTRGGDHEPNRTGGGYPVLELMRAGVHVSGNNSSRLERTRGGDLESKSTGSGIPVLERTRAGVLTPNTENNNLNSSRGNSSYSSGTSDYSSSGMRTHAGVKISSSGVKTKQHPSSSRSESSHEDRLKASESRKENRPDIFCSTPTRNEGQTVRENSFGNLSIIQKSLETGHQSPGTSYTTPVQGNNPSLRDSSLGGHSVIHKKLKTSHGSGSVNPTQNINLHTPSRPRGNRAYEEPQRKVDRQPKTSVGRQPIPASSTPVRTDSQPIRENSFGDLSVIQKNQEEFVLEDLYERFHSTTILFEESSSEDEDSDDEKVLPGDLGFDDTAPECARSKHQNIRAVNREARVHGKAYQRVDGTVVPARCVKPACSCKFLQCYTKFEDDSRKKLLKRFLKLSWSGQNQLLASHMDVTVTSRTEVVNSRRLFTRRYYLPSSTEGRVQVCKLMFQATFDISDRKTRVLAKKKIIGLGIAEDDLRQNNSSHKTIPEEHVEFIRNHIKSFPAYTSHYNRERTEKMYLSSDLNIAKMYNLYKQKCMKVEKEPVHYNSYRLIFRQFKLSFRKPKLDTCSCCDKLTIQLKVAESEDEKAKILKEREAHHNLASAAYAEKRKDVQAAKESGEIRTVSHDLQKCLVTPFLQCGTAFYSRQLWTLNFTLFETCNGQNKAFCHIWDESKAKRGSQEIASCLLMDLNNMDKEVKLVTYYSDRCGGQNLNFVVCGTFLHFAESCRSQGRELTIRHKFMVSGHSHMEVDSIHASIEKAKKRTTISIETPRDWAVFIGSINRKVKLNVIEMEQVQFLALKELERVYKRPKKDTSGCKLSFKEISFFEYRSSTPGLVHFKYNFDDDEYRCFKMANENATMTTPGPIATEPLPLPAEKLEDLQKLLPFVTNKAYYDTLLKNIVPKKRGRKPNNNIVDDFDGDLDKSVLFENIQEDNSDED